MVHTQAQFQDDLGFFHESFPVSDYPAVLAREPRRAAVAKVGVDKLLTVRETEILELFGKGLSVKGIARSFAISPGTVKWHVRNLYEKLGASSREDALSKARLRKIIPL